MQMPRNTSGDIFSISIIGKRCLIWKWQYCNTGPLSAHVTVTCNPGAVHPVAVSLLMGLVM